VNLARAKEVRRAVYVLNMDCPISLFIKSTHRNALCVSIHTKDNSSKCTAQSRTI